MHWQIELWSKVPLYEQIVNLVQDAIIKGELAAGDSLPSIRGLAADLEVSVITTKRAYSDLEEMGLIHSIPGKGSFVSGQGVQSLQEQIRFQWEKKLEELIIEGKDLGIGLEELKDMAGLFYKEDNHAEDE